MWELKIISIMPSSKNIISFSFFIVMRHEPYSTTLHILEILEPSIEVYLSYLVICLARSLRLSIFIGHRCPMRGRWKIATYAFNKRTKHQTKHLCDKCGGFEFSVQRSEIRSFMRESDYQIALVQFFEYTFSSLKMFA